MAIKLLPECVQSILSSSLHINTYKRATEELVYNAIDAGSISIAVRVHIEDNKIQVIDNGDGIPERNLALLGQRHATSKCADLNTLKAVSYTYGYQGQALADIVNISQKVKITSRCENSDTWVKIFYKGKTKELTKTLDRPSKGTTVEIKGFLYNLYIQSKSVHSLNEINEIKSFMQQISLIHCNISLSLRDDSKNEIIFKAHKNRDVCQTIQLLFTINTQDIQQFQVEKNEYKVTAYFVNKYKHVGHTQWIYLNGKFLSNSRLQKLINDKLKNSFKSSKKIKTKKIENEELDIMQSTLPFYVILLSCPYYDYHISTTPKHTILEFKKWDEVTKLLDKLIKFYTGDGVLKKQLKPQNIVANRKVDDTREQVRNIVERLLKNNPKTMGVSQMQNGIKGKLIKRKIKKKPPTISLSKVIPPKTIAEKTPLKKLENFEYPSDNNQYDINNVNKEANFKLLKETEKRQNKHKSQENISNKINLNCTLNNKKSVHIEINSDTLLPMIKKHKKEDNNKRKNKRTKFINKQLPESSYTCDIPEITIQPSSESVIFSGTFLDLNEHIYKCMKNENPSIWTNIEDFISYDFLPHPLKFSQPNYIGENLYKNSNDKLGSTSSHNLLKTILNTQVPDILPSPEEYYSSKKSSRPCSFKVQADIKSPSNEKNELIITSGITYKSHQYQVNHIPNNMLKPKKESRFRFITNYSKDNFINITKLNNNVKFKHKPYKFKENKSKNFDILFETMEKNNENIFQESSHTFKFSNNFNSILRNEFNTVNANTTHSIYNISKTIDLFDSEKDSIVKSDNENEDNIISLDKSCVNKVALLENDDGSRQKANYHNKVEKDTYNLLSNTLFNICYNKNKLKGPSGTASLLKNVISAPNTIHLTPKEDIDPLNVCEVIIHNEKDNILEKEIDFENNKLNDSLFNDTSMENNFNDMHINEINKSNNNALEKDVELNIKDSQFNESLFNIKSMANALNNRHIDEIKESNNKISHHFNLLSNIADVNKTLQNLNICQNITQDELLNENINHECDNLDNENICNNLDEDVNINFDLKTRLNFVPKGLSPIFQNCYTNNTCNYNLEKDYFEDSVYHNFINDIHMNTETFKPIIQNISEINTRDIDKVNSRLHKENSSLTFDAASLRNAKVLNQVDDKYIAATMKINSVATDYLVLFDQHAVHERIRLEANLSDYFDGHKWASVELDEISLKLYEDELVYLHNYKDKFTRFGLSYTVLNNCEITINAIPKAILGKNTRQVDKVITAVKNLILEEINVIKSQRGCISLYPKTIMDLVFSEACRYSVKFGDKLSRDDCIDFLKSLSKCKTPFQCAHGRPVMAVLMNIQCLTSSYQANITKVKAFKTNMEKNTF